MNERCIDLLYEKVSAELPITREQYVATLAGWDIQPINVGENEVGVVMMRGTEIHVVIERGDAIRYGRRIVREVLDANIKRHGFLTTISLKDVATTQFLERLGFYKTGEDEMFCSYRIEQPKMKERACLL